MSLKVTKNHTIFAILYTIFIFSEQIADDGSLLSKLSNQLDGFKIKYLIAILAIGYLFPSYINHHKRYKKFRMESQSIFVTILVLACATIFRQILNGFRSFSYLEIIFWILPILYVYLLVNENEDVKKYINTAFAIQFFFFFLGIWNRLTIHNLMSIDFIHSMSPFESEYSFYGLIFFMYYIYVRDRGRSILSFIMTFLAFKRMAVVYSLLILFLSMIPNVRNYYMRRPKKEIVWILTGVFLLIPLFFHLICSDEFSLWFYTLTGIDFNSFISGRLYRLNLCIDNDMPYGLGSTTQFLNNVLGNGIKRNLHNDILRIYLECGFIGTIAFTCNYYRIAAVNGMSLLLILYLFLDMMFNHFLGAGRTAFWIVIYLTIFYYNTHTLRN